MTADDLSDEFGFCGGRMAEVKVEQFDDVVGGYERGFGSSLDAFFGDSR